MIIKDKALSLPLYGFSYLIWNILAEFPFFVFENAQENFSNTKNKPFGLFEFT
jgi:hypothetical protein